MESILCNPIKRTPTVLFLILFQSVLVFFLLNKFPSSLTNWKHFGWEKTFLCKFESLNGFSMKKKLCSNVWKKRLKFIHRKSFLLSPAWLYQHCRRVFSLISVPYGTLFAFCQVTVHCYSVGNCFRYSQRQTLKPSWSNELFWVKDG